MPVVVSPADLGFADVEVYRPGDRVEYIAAPVFDLIIRTGDVGVVTKVENGWVHAEWPRSGEHSVPVDHVKRAQS